MFGALVRGSGMADGSANRIAAIVMVNHRPEDTLEIPAAEQLAVVKGMLLSHCEWWCIATQRACHVPIRNSRD